MSDRWIKLGMVGVDSGQLMIVDPCYVDDDDPFNYNDLMKQWNEREGQKSIGFPVNEFHPEGLGIVFSGFGGDGAYPIYGHIEDGRLTQVRICLDGRLGPI